MTLGDALQSYMKNITSLAAKVGKFYPTTLPQQPPDTCCTFRFLPFGSGKTLTGATGWQKMRIEITFWGKTNKDIEQCCYILMSTIATQTGALVAGGPTVNVYQLIGPRSIQDTETRYYGYQVDIMCQVNTESAS